MGKHKQDVGSRGLQRSEDRSNRCSRSLSDNILLKGERPLHNCHFEQQIDGIKVARNAQIGGMGFQKVGRSSRN